MVLAASRLVEIWLTFYFERNNKLVFYKKYIRQHGMPCQRQKLRWRVLHPRLTS
jgi:hypothetical protein